MSWKFLIQSNIERDAGGVDDLSEKNPSVNPQDSLSYHDDKSKYPVPTDGRNEDYDIDGKSKTKKKPGDSTTILKKDMPMVKLDDDEKTGYTGGLRPTTEPSGNYSDQPGSKAPEGEMMGLRPSYTSVKSLSEIAINIIGKSKLSKNSNWILNSKSSFDNFVDNAVCDLGKYKKGGLSKSSAKKAVKKAYSYFFDVNSSADKLLNCFADKVYGTVKDMDFKSEVMYDDIYKFTSSIKESKLDKSCAKSKALDHYSAWVDNYPNVNLIIQACLDSVYEMSADSALQVADDVRCYNKLKSEASVLPISYSDFRFWCSKNKLKKETFLILERKSIESSLVLPPVTTPIRADKQVYISDDSTETQAIEVEDPTKKPAKIVSPSGKEMKPAKQEGT